MWNALRYLFAAAVGTWIWCEAALAADMTTLAVEQMCDAQAGGPPDREGFSGISKPAPIYPKDEREDWSEGWALINYTVGADGTTKDFVVVDQMGPDGFVNASLDALRTWRYQPAFVHRKPVDTYGAEIDFIFIFEETGTGERKGFNSEFARAYNSARVDLKAHDYAGAIGLLTRAFQSKLSLYEQAMGSYLIALGLLSADGRNWHDALLHIRHATVDGGRYLEASIKGPALDLLVALEAQDGNYKQAFCTYRHEKLAGAALSPQTAQLGEKIAGLLSSPAPLVIPAQIFAGVRRDQPPLWLHPLVRHRFAFSAVQGDARNFRLVCSGTVLESPINEETQWTVPADAGRCKVFVYGAPGATFQFVEEE